MEASYVLNFYSGLYQAPGLASLVGVMKYLRHTATQYLNYQQLSVLISYIRMIPKPVRERLKIAESSLSQTTILTDWDITNYDCNDSLDSARMLSLKSGIHHYSVKTLGMEIARVEVWQTQLRH